MVCLHDHLDSNHVTVALSISYGIVSNPSICVIVYMILTLFMLLATCMDAMTVLMDQRL